MSKINSQILTIVGGSGFIGKSILDAFNSGLLKKFKINKINIICRKKFKFRKKKTSLKKVKIIYADISKINNLPQSDLYIYAAESTNVNNLLKKNLAKSHKKNIRNFIKLVSKFKNSKVLYTSSGVVNYLNQKNFQDPYKIQYTKLKIFSEGEIKKLKKFKIKSSIARCYTFVGPHLPVKQHYAIGNFLYDAKYKNKILIKNKIKVIRSYMYADDMVRWLILILLNSKINTVTYNVGSDQPVELHSLAEKIAKLFKRKIYISKVKQETNKIDKYVPNINKTKSDLKIKILYNLSRSLKKCLKFV